MSNNNYAIIGYPLGYSLSPLMHNHFFKKEGINASYISLTVDSNGLQRLVEKKQLDGFNVTIPHKEAILSYLTNLTDSAKSIGAVNTVKLMSNGYLGTNTDAEGFLLMLKKEKNLSLENKNIALFGAGGAAKAIAYAAAISGAKSLYIYDPDIKKVESIVNKALKDSRYKIAHKLSRLEKTLVKCDIVINATPVGMEKTIDQSVLKKSELALLPSHAYVVDIIYAPLQTTLLKTASELGLETLNGIGMLGGQGVIAQKFWFGKSLLYEEAKETLVNGL